MPAKEKIQVTIKKAVALGRDPKEERPPQVTAKGQGRVAEKIIALAREHHIPIQEDPDLVEVLQHLDLEEQVPPEVFAVVAEILTFIYNCNTKWAQGPAKSHFAELDA
ncbi:MAG: EscU/YscU/HrcU family type III secretion system export apparatus switch protein [Desulfarculaceae bacterium]|jgi:flagellar biosynthesis protein